MLRLLLAVTIALLAAAPAQAGQIVFVRSHQLWTMKDDGSGARLFIDNVPLAMNDLREPSVTADGAEVAFSGTTLKNAALANGEQHYGINATGVYLWDAGLTTRLTGEPAPCFGCSSFETNPSLGPDRRILSASTFFSTARTGNFGRLLRRPADGDPASTFAAICDDTALGDPAISPRDGERVAYVGCDAQIVVSPAQVAHTVVQRGQFGPDTRSPAWSPDGSQLVAIDRPGDETTEIWAFTPEGGARRVLTAPAGVSIRTVAFLGAGTLVFDADSDLWTAPLTCADCAFPAGATQLTHDGDSTEPAWTRAAVLGGVAVEAVKAKRGFALRIALPFAAKIRLTVRKGRKTVATVKRNVRAGVRTVKVRGLRKGRYTVRVRVPGFRTQAEKVRVRRR
jgi:hypothetical protein